MIKINKKLSYAIVTIVLILTLFPAQTIDAAMKKTPTKMITVTSKEITTKNTYLNVLGIAHNEKYDMILRDTLKSGCVLTYTTSGKKFYDVDIAAILKDKCGPHIDNITFLDITCMEDKFYITGLYYDGLTYKNFYLVTADGKSFEYGDLFHSDIEFITLGYLYKVGEKYLYTVAEGADMGADDESRASYYISKDLKEWDLVKTPVNEKSPMDYAWQLVTVADDGMIICANNSYYEPYQLYYTKDLKTFKKIESGIGYEDSSSRIVALADNSLLRVERSWDDYFDFAGFKILKSNNYTKWNSFFEYNNNEYPTSMNYYRWNSWLDNFIVFTERQKDNSLFIYSSKTKTFNEYSTDIKASLFKGGVYDPEDKDKYNYTIYDEKYILVSNDCYKTSYKILSPVDEIQALTIHGDTLTILGDKNYYVSIKEIKSAIKATHK